MIPAKNQRARLKFARHHLIWTVDQWSKVVWNDKYNFIFVNSDSLKYFWSRQGARYYPQCQLLTMTHVGENVIIRVVSASSRMVQFIELTELWLNIFTKESFKNRCCLMPTMWCHQKLIFQRDNDPYHTSKLVKDYFKSRNMNVFDGTLQFFDLKPMEHLKERLVT
jgi:hypothetical protein